MMSDHEAPTYLNTAAAAKYLGLKTSTLLKWRKERRGPPVLAVSANRKFYARASLDDFMASRAQTFEKQRADSRS